MTKINYSKNSIPELIELAQNKDIKALEQLIRVIQKDIYTIFSHLTNYKDDVSDLTQETLLKMAKALHTLKDKNKFKPWLNQIITHVFFDYNRRRNKKLIELDDKKLEKIKDKLGCEPGEKCLFSEIEKLIKAALLTLPESARISLVLREYEGLSYEDISKITNTTIGTVKSRISRARLKLQEELKEFI